MFDGGNRVFMVEEFTEFFFVFLVGDGGDFVHALCYGEKVSSVKVNGVVELS